MQDMRSSSLLPESYGSNLLGVFHQLQGLANPGLTAQPPGSIDFWSKYSNFDEYLQDFGDYVTLSCKGESALRGTLSVTLCPSRITARPPPSESVASAGTMVYFYATTPSPVLEIELSPLPPPQSNHQRTCSSIIPPAAHIADPQLHLFAQAGSRVISVSTLHHRHLLQLIGNAQHPARVSCLTPCTPDSLSLSHHACTCISSPHLVFC